MSDLASWVGAAGTLSAVVVAVCLWRADKNREESNVARSNKERVHYMIVALRAEIESALGTARRQKLTLEQTLAEIDKAVASGAEVRGTDRIAPDSMSVTDAIVYRALAPEMGRLPPAIIQQTTQFYTLTREAERLTLLGGSVIIVYRALSDLLPRLLMHGAMMVRIFDRFLAADCSADADLKLSTDEVLALARACDYPIEEIAKERGTRL